MTTAGISIGANQLFEVIDAGDECAGCPRRINEGKIIVRSDETMIRWVSAGHPCNLARVVNPGHGFSAGGRVERGIRSVGENEAVGLSLIFHVGPNDLAGVADPPRQGMRSAGYGHCRVVVPALDVRQGVRAPSRGNL